MKEIYLKLDARNRVSLTKLAKGKTTTIYRGYIDADGKIILEPVREIPEEEAWLFAPENKAILDRVKEGLKQKADVDLGSFKKYID